MFQKIYCPFVFSRLFLVFLFLGAIIPQTARSDTEDAKALANDPNHLIGQIEKQFDFDSHALLLGNADGDITIIEFVDYNCVFCKKLHSYLPDAIRQDGSIRLLHIEYPILGTLSRIAARAALAARFQGKHAAYSDALLRSPKLSKNRLFAIARDLNMDVERLKRDMNAPEVELSLTNNLALGKALEVEHTPTLIIANVYVPGMIPRDEFEKLIADIRREAVDPREAISPREAMDIKSISPREAIDTKFIDTKAVEE